MTTQAIVVNTVIALNTPLRSFPPLWQMQALHDVVQKGWVHYIGMSSCWAYQCAHPLLQPLIVQSANLSPLSTIETSPSDAE